MQKNADAFRTISEVADELALPQHVLRFWETRFPQIRPLKRAGGRRYYRPADINLLKSIRALLYDEGYTIKGVQRLLKEQGPKHVTSSAPAGGEVASPDEDDDADLEIGDDDEDAPMPVLVAPNPPSPRPWHVMPQTPAPPPPERPSARVEPAQLYKPQRPAPPEPGLLGSLQRDALEAALMVIEDCERILAPLRRRSA